MASPQQKGALKVNCKRCRCEEECALNSAGEGRELHSEQFHFAGGTFQSPSLPCSAIPNFAAPFYFHKYTLHSILKTVMASLLQWSNLDQCGLWPSGCPVLMDAGPTPWITRKVWEHAGLQPTSRPNNMWHTTRAYFPKTAGIHPQMGMDMETHIHMQAYTHKHTHI